MYNDKQFNIIINKYKKIVDDISEKYNYDKNLKSILYIIIPAFIIKYGINNENIIINTFNTIPIEIENEMNETNPAYFIRKIHKTNNNYMIIRKIIIKDYNIIKPLNLLDSLIHEYNHAINSIKNELTISNSEIILRTGISLFKYDKDLKLISKENNTLEEIINTNDVSDIINLIKDFNKYDIENIDIKSTIDFFHNKINNKYKSNSYLLQSTVCKTLLSNRTFINTLSNLRFKGEINDINNWFDNITTQKNSFKKLNDLLNDSLYKEKCLNNKKLFKQRIINKIKNNIIEIKHIIELFNNNCIIK